ncbi:MAG: hypothetical protein AAB697_03650 [Patescibacteria group bacterium]
MSKQIIVSCEHGEKLTMVDFPDDVNMVGATCAACTAALVIPRFASYASTPKEYHAYHSGSFIQAWVTLVQDQVAKL